jgi:hypothetical protein
MTIYHMHQAKRNDFSSVPWVFPWDFRTKTDLWRPVSGETDADVAASWPDQYLCADTEGIGTTAARLQRLDVLLS